MSVNSLPTPPSRPQSALILLHPSRWSTHFLHHQAGHSQHSFFLSITLVSSLATPPSRPQSALILLHPSRWSTHKLHHQAGHSQHSFFFIHHVGQLTSYTTKQATVSTHSSSSITLVNSQATPPSRPRSALILLHPSRWSTHFLHHQAGHSQHSFFFIHHVGQLTNYTTKQATVSTHSSSSITLINSQTML
jgi:hypothetical protein